MFYIESLHDRTFSLWCQGQDSNLRSPSGQRFYRPSVLATHPPWLKWLLPMCAASLLRGKAADSRCLRLWFLLRPVLPGVRRIGARGGIRTLNLPITNRLRCRCATRAEPASSCSGVHKNKAPKVGAKSEYRKEVETPSIRVGGMERGLGGTWRSRPNSGICLTRVFTPRYTRSISVISSRRSGWPK